MKDITQKIGSPFHQGEQSLQERIGKKETMDGIGRRAVRSFMPAQHREFFRQLPFVVVGSVDNQNNPWASMVFGEAGFIQSPTETSLSLSTRVIAGDPLQDSINETGRPLGLLGIELMSRRRNRVNVRIGEVNDNMIALNVDQSFGNCPQYIQTRHYQYVRPVGSMSPSHTVEHFSNLDKMANKLIDNADTFFVASFVPALEQPVREGVDVSHRGGMPGFVKREGNQLTIPDFPGNHFFNTLGNFLINPKAGLLFPDFITGDLLQLTGSVELLLEDDPEVLSFRGAERAWRFTVIQGQWLKDALPFRSLSAEYSPNSEMMGTWQEAKKRLAMEGLRNRWQSYRVEKIEPENSVICSYYLRPADGSVVLPFYAGQHLTVKVPIGKQDNIRNYTVSNAPNEYYYRLSIKREERGSVSNFFHDDLIEGQVIQVKVPTGHFYIDAKADRPAVLIAGGVGVTPMMSMAQHIANEGKRTRYTRQLTVFHACRTIEERAFFRSFNMLQKETEGKLRYLSVISQPDGKSKIGRDFTVSGRINADVFRQEFTLDSYSNDHIERCDFYICGPNGFMQTMYDELIALGVEDGRIYAEAFGPSALQRKVIPGGRIKESDRAMIRFSESGIEREWRAGDKTLLEVAEDQGLTPAYSCRSGSCGSCSVRLQNGAITYRNPPTASIEPGKVLLCCAVPAKGENTIVLAM
ncbi:pyridoxamine 5'-phosphate oxidase family protein [Marinomonas sp. 15G1-11]|uniref:Pyridoxamine 5'-phosphate oxidase family protein n=1 Tax=Marinomonas phaeophyticola TaxID=3004091 RepID=A0ABT4JPJ5_9GAMM|nr:pyridoxamine 5'-phosphate oxidase family protein [Marinomonas sp. 15G1-11]MCZ2720279.1 pyridoxamine 5'-phosphate oxidase family protein [Marinomonas sp. 15G1-11]